jgi:hypothetical protein
MRKIDPLQIISFYLRNSTCTTYENFILILVLDAPKNYESIFFDLSRVFYTEILF